MTAVAADRIASAAHAYEVARRLADGFATGAARRDRDRELPHREIDELAASGLLAITVPAHLGGPDLPPSAVAEVVRILAAADPNIAQIPHSHFVYVNLLRLAGSADQRRRYLGQVLDGGRIANAQSERSGATVAEISTTVRPAGGRLRIDGVKYYCTGSLFADVLAVLTRLDDPEESSGLEPGEYIAYLPAETPGVRIIDDWNGIGQRTTGSGTVSFDGVVVEPGQLVPRSPAVRAPTGYGAFAQLLHVAVDAGIARGALTAATDFVRAKSRPWFEAGVERAVDDPLLIQRFGELAVAVTAAEATLAAAGAAVDRAVGAGPGVGTTTGPEVAADSRSSERDPARPADRDGASGAARNRAGRLVSDEPYGRAADESAGLADRAAVRAVDEPVAAASLAVAAAKILADGAANEVSSALFEVGGTRSAAADLNLHHFWRNARTHTLHDPVRWKYQHIGRTLLHDTPPPLHGVI
ncbi:acyl-CoA dehydrogenase family protein [Nocardia mexicana]|uniref:Dibenzothiophene monooxygenase n=1 Tax=Nocardia mexicana TaxID=279262 RepID=A0A370GE10_9NOCA|nr:acyl-CoA dehydrogenase family protein [Nocardia mexicana]RDI42035.1 alkylation response protein AidB-like acyl-CoA dehydrogenase [Nocardia mexicana]